MLTLKIYQIITYIIRPLFFIFFFIRILNNKEEKGKFFERKGFSKNKRPPGKLIWIHAASVGETLSACLLYTSPSPRDATLSRMPSSA